MDDLNSKVRVEGENGDAFDMIILKEFNYKDKRYAVLMEEDTCSCDCNTKHDDCECNHDCNCENDCECGCMEKGIYILEISTDDSGNEIFKSIDDEKLFDEVACEADKVLYED